MRYLLVVLLMINVTGTAMAYVTDNSSDTAISIKDSGIPYLNPSSQIRATGDITGDPWTLMGIIEWDSYPPFPADGQRDTFPFAWHQTIGGNDSLPCFCTITHNSSPSDPESFAWIVESDGTGHAAVTLTEGNGYHQLRVGHAYRFEVTAVGYNTLWYEFTVGGDNTGTGELAAMHGLWLDLPNPLMVGSEVRYRVPSTGRAQIDVFDLHGRLVRRLVGESVQAGEHATHWNGRSETGAFASRGVYFFRLSTNAGQATGKCVLLR